MGQFIRVLLDIDQAHTVPQMTKDYGAGLGVTVIHETVISI